MKTTGRVILTLVITLILLTVWIFVAKSAVEYEAKTTVVIANTGIEMKTLITESMLTTKEVDISDAHRLSFKTVDDLVGKRALMNITNGELLLTTKVGYIDEMDFIDILNKYNRLYTIEFKNDQVNGWWVKVGQLVDIIYVPRRTTNAVSTKIEIMKNVRVAAIISEDGQLIKNDKRVGVKARYISFEVTPDQIELLAYYKENGVIEISVIPEG